MVNARASIARVPNDDGAGPDGRGQPLVGVHRERVVLADIAVSLPDPLVEQAKAAVRAVDMEPGVPVVGDACQLTSGSTSPVFTSPALPTTATGVQPAAISASMAPPAPPTSMRPVASSAMAHRFRRPSPSTPSARCTTWWVAVLAYTRGSGMAATPSSEGRSPRRSPACCRAAPMPARLAVDPPAVKLPANVGGKPRSSTSQRPATVSTRLPACAHHRCGEATLRRELGGRGHAGGHRGDPARESRMADTQAKGDDPVRQSCEGLVPAEPDHGQWLVQARRPGGPARRRIASLEAQERLQGRQECLDGPAQVGGRCGIGRRVDASLHASRVGRAREGYACRVDGRTGGR